MSDNLDINPGLKANEIVSPDNPHTEPPFQRPVYEQPVEEPEEVKVDVKKSSKSSK